MSIIHEALKKVQQSMSIPQAKSEEMVEVLTVPSPNIPNKRPSSLFLLTIGLIVLVGTGLYFSIPFRSSYLSLQSKPAVTARPNINVHTNTHPPVQAPNAPPVSLLALFNLQGVMADGRHSVALINGNIYEEGALVNGARIIRIDLDSVTIERNGKQETISVKK